MKEDRKEVKTFVISAYCDKCGGEMKSAGLVLTSNPPYYIHKCEWCGAEEQSHYVYPRTVYKYVEVEE